RERPRRCLHGAVVAMLALSVGASKHVACWVAAPYELRAAPATLAREQGQVRTTTPVSGSWSRSASVFFWAAAEPAPVEEWLPAAARSGCRGGVGGACEAELRAYPLGLLADRVVGFGGAPGRHLEGVLLPREDVEAYLHARLAGALGEPASVVEKRLV